MKHLSVFRLLSILLLIAGLAGCVPANNRPSVVKRVSSGDPSAPAMEVLELQAENEQLKIRLLALEKKLNTLEKNKQSYEKNVLSELKQMDETIALMEQVIAEERQQTADLQAQIAARQAVTQKVVSKPEKTPERTPDKKIADAPSGVEIKTPEDSNAIEAFRFEDSKSPKPKGKSIQSKKVVSQKSLKKAYSDSDLIEAKLPIALSVQPGAKQAYINAYKAFSRAQYQEAVNLFQQFIKEFPNDLDADNAMYWMGQSNWRLGRKSLAEKNFRKVLTQYKHGETVRGFKTPDSILMLGRIYLDKGNRKKAGYYFEEVLEKYPQSSSAGKAKRELQAIRSIS